MFQDARGVEHGGGFEIFEMNAKASDMDPDEKDGGLTALSIFPKQSHRLGRCSPETYNAELPQRTWNENFENPVENHVLLRRYRPLRNDDL